MRTWLWVGLVAFAQGCAISPSATLRKEGIANHEFVATDSRLRVITSSEIGFLSTTGAVDPKRIICMEPSPDVATTIANSFGVGASIFGQGSGSLSSQQVEGLVQLGERTAAIQLLRDKMYQTCIAYANGAISGTTYSLLMSRLDDSIVTLALGDGAAGNFGRNLSAVGGEAGAKADAVLTGLPNTLSTIDDQVKKLAAANQKVDDAANALKSHNASQPATGKEEDYKSETAKLEAALTTAKAERDALVLLMQNTIRGASEATGKISQLQAGGGLSPKPNAEILRDMQADFLLTDVGRDLAYACMVELGLRGDESSRRDLRTLGAGLHGLLMEGAAAEESARLGADYVSAINVSRHTELTGFCKESLLALVTKTGEQSHAYRMYRAKLGSEVATARYGADTATASAAGKQLLIDAINLCESKFKDDAARKKACLDQVIPIRTEQKTQAASKSSTAPDK